MKESQLLTAVRELHARVQAALELVQIATKEKEIADLAEQTADPDLWADADRARAVGQRLSDLQAEVRQWRELERSVADLEEVVALDEADQTVSLREEGEQRLAALTAQFEKLEFTVLFSGRHDSANAIVAVHAGAGGVDAQDWAAMLVRMLTRFCESQGFGVTVVDESRGAEAGIKSVVLEVVGRYAYGWLRSENGVHRLVRISPFDAEKMRHTSFALVEVIPELEEAGAVDLKPDELRVDVYRAGGHGGQGVNTTDSAVRITHLPTGIVVTCQNERSQHQNKATAMKILQAKLQRYQEAEREEERMRLRGEYTEAAWGNQARSYVLHPYKMVKDHRTDHESSDPDAVLNGDLTPFVEAYLRATIVPE